MSGGRRFYQRHLIDRPTPTRPSSQWPYWPLVCVVASVVAPSALLIANSR